MYDSRQTHILWTSIGQLRSRHRQSALLDNKARNLFDTQAALQIRKDERPFAAHSHCVPFHYLKARTYKRSQIYLVYNEKIGARNPRATLARYFVTLRDVDHIDR